MEGPQGKMANLGNWSRDNPKT